MINMPFMPIHAIFITMVLYYNFLKSGMVRSQLLFIQIVLAMLDFLCLLGVLCFHMKLKIFFISISGENCVGIFMGIALNL